MQVANTLILNDINPDTFCLRVPYDYIPKNYTLEEIVTMGSEASEEVIVATKKTGNPEVHSAIVDGNMGDIIFDPTALPHV